MRFFVLGSEFFIGKTLFCGEDYGKLKRKTEDWIIWCLHLIFECFLCKFGYYGFLRNQFFCVWDSLHLIFECFQCKVGYFGFYVINFFVYGIVSWKNNIILVRSPLYWASIGSVKCFGSFICRVCAWQISTDDGIKAFCPFNVFFWGEICQTRRNKNQACIG
jgi:hypothetical protein